MKISIKELIMLGRAWFDNVDDHISFNCFENVIMDFINSKAVRINGKFYRRRKLSRFGLESITADTCKECRLYTNGGYCEITGFTTGLEHTCWFRRQPVLKQKFINEKVL